MSRPVLELIAGTESTAWATPLLRSLRRWCEPRAGDPALGSPAARLVIGSDARGLGPLLSDESVPLAVAALDPDQVESPLRDRAVAIVAPATRAGARDVIGLPARSVDVALHQPVTPFVRSRWRQRLGLDEELVIDFRDPVNSDAPTATLTALAAAVVATDDTALTALALGTPTVLEEACVRSLGLDAVATGGFLATSAADADHEAALLAGDRVRAADMGRRARRIAENDFSTNHAAELVAKQLGLSASTPPGLTGFGKALHELHTPPLAPQALHALDTLGPVVDTASLADLGAGR